MQQGANFAAFWHKLYPLLGLLETTKRCVVGLAWHGAGREVLFWNQPHGVLFSFPQADPPFVCKVMTMDNCFLCLFVCLLACLFAPLLLWFCLLSCLLAKLLLSTCFALLAGLFACFCRGPQLLVGCRSFASTSTPFWTRSVGNIIWLILKNSQDTMMGKMGAMLGFNVDRLIQDSCECCALGHVLSCPLFAKILRCWCSGPVVSLAFKRKQTQFFF